MSDIFTKEKRSWIMSRVKNRDTQPEYSRILDFTGMPSADRPGFGRELVRTIKNWTGIPVSLGVGPTKTLAKVANRIAKKAGEDVFSLMDTGMQDKYLAGMPVEDVWGINRNLGFKLRRQGIGTAADLKAADPFRMRKQFSIVMERMVLELNGEPCLVMEEVSAAKKQIHVSRSFGRPVTTLEDMEEAVACYAARVSEKLRTQGSVAKSAYVYIRTSYFKASPVYANAATAAFPAPTNSSVDFVREALGCLRGIFRSGIKYKKAGVMALDILGAKACFRQGDLFAETKKAERMTAMMRTIDHINADVGRGTVFLAAQGIGRGWGLRAGMRSPRYTTRWNELPAAKA